MPADGAVCRRHTGSMAHTRQKPKRSIERPVGWKFRRMRHRDNPGGSYQGILRATKPVAVTPRGGADCDDPCHLSWYFCREPAALKNGRTHHPCLRKNRGRLLWCPQGRHSHPFTSGTSATPTTIANTLENAVQSE